MISNNLLKRVQDMKGPSDSDILWTGTLNQLLVTQSTYSWYTPSITTAQNFWFAEKKNVKSINPDKLKISNYNNNLVSSRYQTSRDKIITIRVYLLLAVCSGIHGWRQPFVD